MCSMVFLSQDANWHSLRVYALVKKNIFVGNSDFWLYSGKVRVL